jgi:nitroreductase
MNNVIELLKNHRSIRKFKEKAVEEETLRIIIEAAQCASTSNYIQAYTVIQVCDAGIRKEIAELSGPQVWVEQSPLFFVFCADVKRLDGACTVHGKKMEKGNAEQFIIATVDAALMAQNTMIAAESLGLGGVFIGGIRNNPSRVCELLDIPDDVYPVFGMCLGYPDDEPERKPRLPVDIVLKKDRYSTEGDHQRLEAYDEATCEYYNIRSTCRREDTWTGQMAEMMSKVMRPHMKAFINRKGFFVR